MSNERAWLARRLEVSPVASDSAEVREALKAWQSMESNPNMRAHAGDFKFGRISLNDVKLVLVVFTSPSSIILGGTRVWGTLRISYSEPAPVEAKSK